MQKPVPETFDGVYLIASDYDFTILRFSYYKLIKKIEYFVHIFAYNLCTFACIIL